MAEPHKELKCPSMMDQLPSIQIMDTTVKRNELQHIQQYDMTQKHDERSTLQENIFSVISFI